MAQNNTDIKFLKGVGEVRAEKLKSVGIDTVGALLRFYPRAYIDFGKTVNILNAPYGENVCIRAKVISEVKEYRKRHGLVLYTFLASDGTASMEVVLFNQKYLAAKINSGSEYLFYGKVEGSMILRKMSSPEIMETGFSGIHPVYRSIKGLTSKNIEKLMKNALLCLDLPETLPQSIIEKNNLPDIKFATENIHFPKTEVSLERAKHRLVFEELFVLQTSLLLLKGKNYILSGAKIEKDFKTEFLNLLPFKPTNAQSRVIDECVRDLMSGRKMSRLVQGDVGSGKTAVAAALCYIMAKNGYQSAFMAPTEILAAQHFYTLSKMLENSSVTCCLLTGSMTKKQKSDIKQSLKKGEIDIAVGTHALITNDVEFCCFGLAITDEQHRFGVQQRSKLSEKGENPHTLVMSATPIPRTLALILYGDLDISIIDEYPAGRQKIDTFCVDKSYHKRIYTYIKKHIDEGRQGYIVCPLVEESEQLDVTSAEEYFEKLRQDDFKGYSVGLLHGKMSPKLKDTVMLDFKQGKIQLLVSTTVVEVGVDVPNAVIMVIEDADRFGLSQLHQLRGRIGRGEYKSTCILVSDSKQKETRERLQVIVKNNDGFKIADEDLNLRGPGDFLGNRQHGLPELKIADLFADKKTLIDAGNQARELLKFDPRLKSLQNEPLRKEIINMYKKFVQN